MKTRYYSLTLRSIGYKPEFVTSTTLYSSEPSARRYWARLCKLMRTMKGVEDGETWRLKS